MDPDIIILSRCSSTDNISSRLSKRGANVALAAATSLRINALEVSCVAVEKVVVVSLATTVSEIVEVEVSNVVEEIVAVIVVSVVVVVVPVGTVEYLVKVIVLSSSLTSLCFC